jgi:hypothetical protein
VCSRVSRRFARAARAALIGVFPLAAGCLTFEAPDRFLVVERGTDVLKAITPDEAKLWVREFSDPDGGSLDFWSDALKSDFVSNRGYTLLEEHAVKDHGGEKGLELLFELTAAGAAQRYLAVLFVYEGCCANTIRTIEFVAPRDLFERYAADVRKSVATIRKTFF